MKSTVDEIRRRFDADVERFSNLETGQSATVDAPLALALVAEAAAVTTPHARHVLDVGCGAGNYTLKLLERLPNLDATLIDLSQPMLDRARERVSRATTGRLSTVQGDIREVPLPEGEFEIVLAAAVLHHLRADEEWRDVFAAFHREAGPKGAPAILLLHSFPTSSHMFRNLIPALADEFHLVAPDYPGFGHSSAPPVGQFEYTFDKLADVVEQFTEQIGL